MAKIRKINVSEIEGRSPFNQDDEAIMPSGTVVVYEKDNNGVIEYVLRVHDGITNGGVALGAGPTPAIFNGSDGIIASNLNEGIAAVFNNGDVYITGGESVRFTGIGEFEGFSVPVLRFWNAEGRHSTNNDTTELVELRVGNDADEGDPTEGFFKIRTEKQDPESNKEWKFDANGVLTLPEGGVIRETVVTDNPTIELEPANADAASQKLIIKGGGGFPFTQNDITVYVSDLTLSNGGIVYGYIQSSNPNLGEGTHYWWLEYDGETSPADVSSGQININEFNNGSFSFTIVDDTIPFRVYVGTVDGVENSDTGKSLLINEDADTDSSWHLHLTTGDLTETSIFLGTDNHNVRTKANGGIEINTYLYPSGGGSGKWTFDNSGNLTLPNDAVIRTDGSNVEVGGVANFNIEAAGVVNIYTDTNGVAPHQWQFGDDGDLTVPGGIVAEYQEDFTITTSYLGMSSPPGPVDRTFTFTANGNLTFPDGTTQTSAYIPTITTGNSVVASPGGIGRNGMSIWLTNAGQVQMSFDSNINVKGRYAINGGATTVIDPPNGATQVDTRYNIGTALNLDDHLTATIVDSSFHNVYRLTVILRQKDTTPGSEFTTAYVIIEELQ